MQHSRLGRLALLFAVFLLLATAAPSVFARGSFGGGGRSFGGGGRSFGGGGRSFGGGGFGGFGGSRPSFTPAPRPSFTPPPRPSFTPAPAPVPAAGPSFAPSSGSFGRGGAVGNQTSNRFSATSGTGGSFGKTGTAGTRSFTSTSRHDPPPAPPPVVSQPYSPAFSHPYYYGGRPANVYFGGGYSDYSFGHYGHPYYGWMPWTPVFYYNPPIYVNGGYVSGGFSFLHLLLGIVFWIVVIAVVVAVFRHFRSRQTY